MNVQIQKFENPRLEKENHYYKADHNILKELGFKPTRLIDDEIDMMLDDLITYKDRINEKKDSIIKFLNWQR